jgi:hypothetical protein
MSRSAAETVQSLFEHFGSGKIQDAARDLLAEDFVLLNPLPAVIPFGGRYAGSAGFLEYMGLISESIEMLEFVVDEIMSEGERVVVVGREKSRVRATSRIYEMDWVHVFRASEGRIHSMREYNDTAAMLVAFT